MALEAGPARDLVVVGVEVGSSAPSPWRRSREPAQTRADDTEASTSSAVNEARPTSADPRSATPVSSTNSASRIQLSRPARGRGRERGDEPGPLRWAPVERRPRRRTHPMPRRRTTRAARCSTGSTVRRPRTAGATNTASAHAVDHGQTSVRSTQGRSADARGRVAQDTVPSPRRPYARRADGAEHHQSRPGTRAGRPAPRRAALACCARRASTRCSSPIWSTSAT